MDELEICDVSMSSLILGNLRIFSCFEHMSPTSILWEMGFSGISLVAETIARSLKSGSLQCDLCCGQQRRDPND